LWINKNRHLLCGLAKLLEICKILNFTYMKCTIVRTYLILLLVAQHIRVSERKRGRQRERERERKKERGRERERKRERGGGRVREIEREGER
jgi:hypothetical protein